MKLVGAAFDASTLKFDGLERIAHQVQTLSINALPHQPRLFLAKGYLNALAARASIDPFFQFLVAVCFGLRTHRARP